MAVIAVEDLFARYENRTALENIHFTVEKGDCLCVVGESGAGKSTLIRCLAGLVSPTSGTITYGEGLRPSTIGFLPQQNESAPHLPASAKEIVRAGIVARKRAFVWLNKAETERVRQAMEQMDVWDLRDRRYADLSGGQRQRVLLARTLAAADSLLLLDEPTAGLDAAMATDISRIVRQIHRSGVTVVMAANDAREALQCATHILHLGGRMLFYGTAQEYLRSDVGFSYLNRPGTV